MLRILCVIAAVAVGLAVPSAAQAQTPLGPAVSVPGTSVYVRAFSHQGDWQTAFDKAAALPTIQVNGRTLRPRLAEARSFAIDSTITNTYGSQLHNFWLAGYRERSSNQFAPWSWATSGAGFSYTNWGSSQPSNTAGKEDRLNYWMFGSSIKWNDISRNNTGAGFVVEYR